MPLQQLPREVIYQRLVSCMERHIELVTNLSTGGNHAQSLDKSVIITRSDQRIWMFWLYQSDVWQIRDDSKWDPNKPFDTTGPGSTWSTFHYLPHMEAIVYVYDRVISDISDVYPRWRIWMAGTFDELLTHFSTRKGAGKGTWPHELRKPIRAGWS
jgi:hypothetical protein